MKCPSCGTELPDTAIFCFACRTDIEPAALPTSPAAPARAGESAEAPQSARLATPAPAARAVAAPTAHATEAAKLKGFEAWFARHIRPHLTPENSIRIVVGCIVIVALSIVLSLHPWHGQPRHRRAQKIASHLKAMPKPPSESTVTVHTSDELAADNAKKSGGK